MLKFYKDPTPMPSGYGPTPTPVRKAWDEFVATLTKTLTDSGIKVDHLTVASSGDAVAVTVQGTIP